VIAPLHILTACSRPAGLPAIATALACAPRALGIQWHIAYDLFCEHIGGQAVKNRMLDSIADGWVWICDDDNTPTLAFLARLASLDPDDLIIFGQQRTDGYHAPAVPQIGATDAAQAVVSRRAIGDLRLPEVYDGDGRWLMAIHARLGHATLINEPLTTYNAQRGPNAHAQRGTL